jgi:hypothetical protein
MGKLKELVQVMGQSSPSTFVECKQNEMTILHRAAYDSNTEVVDLLINEINYIDQVVNENDN